MIVTFQTRGGARYHLDHLNSQFVQELPRERVGPMWNKPSVVVGKRVNIFTASDNPAVPLRCIQTGIVVSREVTLETVPESNPLQGKPS